jgi:hypothetical protein
MSIRAMNFILAAGLMLGVASSAAAQAAGTGTSTNPTFELSAGYQFLHVPDESFPFGLNVDGMRHFGPLGLVAEAGWAHDSDSDDSIDADFSANVWNFGAGPRWTKFGAGRMWPYAQVIVGAEVVHTSVEIAGDSAGNTDTSFMVQPGVGATFIGGDGWGVFGQVDYRRTFFDEGDDSEDSINNQFRVYVGLRMILD